MLKLLLVRHGEALKKLGQTDFERELNESGIAEAKQAQLHLRSINIDRVYSSNAPRAQKTANLIFKDAIYVSKLYNADDSTIIELIKTFEDKFKTIAIVGHNPGITSTVRHLNLDSKISTFTKAMDYNSTCKIVSINIDTTNWNQAFHAPSFISDVFIPTKN